MKSTVKCTGEPTLTDRLKSLAVYPLPQHLISRVVHAATRWRTRWWKNGLIHWFSRTFGVDISEAAETDPTAYPTFNAFFTRALKPGARPLPADPLAIASPADGTLSALGAIDGDTIVQAKGHDFSLTQLLGGDELLAQRFRGGQFATVYLSPRDYHRVHMPAEGLLRAMVHVPGRLYSVASFTVKTVRGIFARNERVVAIFETSNGPMAVVLVGAINVASIETVWAGVVTPPAGKRVRRWDYQEGEVPPLARGDELGRFNMGSTAIVLFGPGQAEWLDELEPDQKVKMGQPLGRLLSDPKVVRLDSFRNRV